MFTIKNQTREGKIFKCTIFVGNGRVVFFTGVAPEDRFAGVMAHIFQAWLFT